MMTSTCRKTVSFIEPTEGDMHNAEFVLMEEKIRSLWYTADEYRRMLLDYKMTSEIRILVDTLQSRRSHQLIVMLLKAQENHKVNRRQKELLSLGRIIEELSCQRQRIAHLKAVKNAQAIIHPDNEVSQDKLSPDMIRAKQRFNRLMRQLNRALVA
jgi:hypothetical protein